MSIPPRKIAVAHTAPPSPFAGLPRVAKIAIEQVHVGMARGARIHPFLAVGADLPERVLEAHVEMQRALPKGLDENRPSDLGRYELEEAAA
jgi:hypothetical protein